MKDFEYYNPTKIVFGEGKIAKLDSLVAPDARVLVLYGGGSAKKNGTLDEVLEALPGRTLVEFGGIEANPQYTTLMKAVEVVKEKEIDFLLAVGGGSVIDGTKFVAAAACFVGDPWDILLTRGDNVTQAMPFGSVLTLPATGSEMNCGSVITRAEKNAKLAFLSPHVFPVFSVLDPQKTLTLPEKQVANGIADAFVHVVEQYITYPSDAHVQDRYAESLMRILIEEGPKALQSPKDIDVRANLMWTATMALNGLIGAGVPQDWTTHMIGHELTALHGIDHAQTLAIVLPGLWTVCKKQKSAKLLQYAERVWDISEGSESQRIDAVIEKTEQFFQSLGIKTRLGDYGLGEGDVHAIVKQLEEHGMVKLGENGDVTPEVSTQILLARL